MTSDSSPLCCIECVMTYLLYGDGAICLACQQRLYARRSDG